MRKIDLDWKKNREYLEFDEKAFEYKLKKDAPQEVLDSYARYLEQLRRESEKEKHSPMTKGRNSKKTVPKKSERKAENDRKDP